MSDQDINYSDWCHEDLVAEIPKLHDLLSNSRERLQKRCAELDSLERELATVTKERDSWATQYERQRAITRDWSIAQANLTTERDSLRAEVERLTKALVAADPFTMPEVKRGPASREWIKMREMVDAIANNSTPAQSEPSQVAEKSVVQELWDSDSCQKCRKPMEVCRCGEPSQRVGTAQLSGVTIPIYASEPEEPSQVGGKEAPKRTHLVESAGYWFNGARKAQLTGRPYDAVGFMENAYNHVENALFAAREELAAAQATIAELQSSKQEDARFYKTASDEADEWRHKWDQLRAENAALRVRVTTPPQNDLPTV